MQRLVGLFTGGIIIAVGASLIIAALGMMGFAVQLDLLIRALVLICFLAVGCFAVVLGVGVIALAIRDECLW